MDRDFYAAAYRIADALAAEGLVDEADLLRAVIASGATGTEILMGIRWHLQNVDRANKIADPSTKREIRELLSEANKLLA